MHTLIVWQDGYIRYVEYKDHVSGSLNPDEWSLLDSQANQTDILNEMLAKGYILIGTARQEKGAIYFYFGPKNVYLSSPLGIFGL